MKTLWNAREVVVQLDNFLIYKAIIYMEAFSIISLILVCGLVVERIFKHFKKSTCCGSTIEFNENASVPDLTKLPLSRK